MESISVDREWNTDQNYVNCYCFKHWRNFSQKNFQKINTLRH